MAETLSLVASIIAVVGIGGQAAKAVRKLASIKDAPDFLMALNNEITDLHLVVVAVENVFQKQLASGITVPGNRAGEIHVDTNMTNSLQYAKDKTADLEALYHQLDPSLFSSGSSNRINKVAWIQRAKVAWMREHRKVRQMQKDIRSARLRLTAALEILNSSTLQRLQEGVQVTQNIIQDLKTLQLQSESAQSQRANSHKNVAQLIQDKLGGLQELQEQNATTQSQRLVEYEATLQQPLSQLLAGQRQIEVKLSGIEASFPTRMESQTGAIIKSILKPWDQPDRTWTSESTQITATVVCTTGAKGCLCSCHRHGRLYKRSPKILDRFLGILFIGYLGIPYVNEPCDDADCAQHSGSNIRLVYLFPAWLLARSLVLLLKLSPAHGPELNIRLPRVVSSSSRVFTCASKGDIVGMREVLTRGLGSPMDVDAVHGYTPLIVAVWSFKVEVCQLLLHAGADPFAEDAFSNTCIDRVWIQILANNGDESSRERFRALFPVQQPLEGFDLSLLHRTVLGLNPIPLDTLLASLPRSAIDQVDVLGRTALYWAAVRGDFSATSQLLKSGADPNKATLSGTLPLNETLEGKHNSCTRILLEYGSDTRYRGIVGGYLPVHLSCYYGSDVDIVESLLDGGISVDDKVRYSNKTPLMIAAEEGHLHIAKYLLSRGADLNATNSDGETSIFIAIQSNHPECVALLLQKGADPTSKTKFGANLLHHAAQFGDLVCIKALQAYDLAGIDPNDKITADPPNQTLNNIKGLTALQIVEKRPGVTTEWKDKFWNLVDGIEHPERKLLINILNEPEGFQDALEQQVG